jgi:catechol 2,3-dioxygenase-like lactoylglutathione lyase family enzyme
MPPPGAIDDISAVTLPVRAMAPSVAFYARLGFAVSYGGGQASFTTMRAGRAVINLRRSDGEMASCSARVILRVRGVDALHAELTARGLRPTAPRDAEWGERYCELRDPDGVVISLAEVIEEQS